MTETAKPPTPDVADADVLAALGARLDEIASAQRELARAVATAVDAVDALHERLARSGVDVDARARSALRLAELGTRDTVVEAADAAVELAATAPAALATAVDALDALAARAAAEGIDLDARGRNALVAAEILTDPRVVDLLRQVQRLAPRLGTLLSRLEGDGTPALDALDTALVALADARPGAGTSLWSLFRSVSRPGTSRFISFLQDFAERYGTALSRRADRSGE